MSDGNVIARVLTWLDDRLERNTPTPRHCRACGTPKGDGDCPNPLCHRRAGDAP